MKTNINNATTEEMDKYRHVLDGKCVLVEDCWFPAIGAKNAKRKYRLEFKRRELRNRRRRELRKNKRQEAMSALLSDILLDGPKQRHFTDMAPNGASTNDDSPVQQMVKNAQWQLFHRPSYELLVHPSEVLTLILLFDLVGLLDRVIRYLWRQAINSGEMPDDPNLVREVSRIKKERTTRRNASNAPLDTEHRLACERRKVLCRSTVATCPTATDIRVAWHFRKRSHEDSLILGGLLMDLECYLDNSLWREKQGTSPLIKGRNPGIRGWLRENCPELTRKYFTLMRWKGMVRRLRQSLEVQDPIPTSALLNDTTDTSELRTRAVQVQPRGAADDEEFRFPWEHGEWRIDATGRQFLTNDGYERAPNWPFDTITLDRHLIEVRHTLREILTAARTAASHSTSRRHSHMAAIHLCREITRRVNEREIWWRDPLAAFRT